MYYIVKLRLIKKQIIAMLMLPLLLMGASVLAGDKASAVNLTGKANSEISAPGMEQKEEESKVSINNATAQELTALQGIGAKKAEAIIEYREKYGAFTEVEQLQEVPGIGPALFAKNQERLKL